MNKLDKKIEELKQEIRENGKYIKIHEKNGEYDDMNILIGVNETLERFVNYLIFLQQ